MSCPVTGVVFSLAATDSESQKGALSAWSEEAQLPRHHERAHRALSNDFTPTARETTGLPVACYTKADDVSTTGNGVTEERSEVGRETGGLP